MANLKQIKHLTSRAGFGMGFDEFKASDGNSVKQAVKDLFAASANYEPLAIVNNTVDYSMVVKGDKSTRKMFMQEQRREEKELNLGWIKQMSTTQGTLREKMALFWNNHFACRAKQGAYTQQLANIQRSNALGNFKAMTLEISKSPAMLQFLNNQQNLKGHPNENFARELMELFTIGRGNYTEQDVKESARAFTGWGFDRNGEFKFRPFVHDNGQKTFLGKTGNFKGEDIIDILFGKKETARFVGNKLYKYLVNETPDPAHVDTMADVFYNANYEIKPLLEYVFTADWFYGDKNVGNLVKSPVELIVGLNRQFGINYQRPEVLLQFQKVLGQVLFYPPNVAGWPGGRSWIDSSSLMYRLKIPSTVLNGGVIDFTGKADPEDEAFLATMHTQQENVNMRVQAQPDWNKFLGEIPKGMNKTSIAEFMLQPKLSNALMSSINQSTNIKAMVIEVVSSPEYQLS
ncbi:DUF1800 domain-containing protein [Mucilaginibacter corticis]|uniref:DUF1800 domain-containing protein n=1 Tax=Mucilaginibacter corticis TaxID=2597670 RepID=A0A556MVM6_9SPHI|nr:DUF1800 domain-containing protein [Mucilaginibacter corticis]TSJ43849.1 DUF1800 domain-containing protein [Mucilaginibacter corticis]